MTEQKIKVIQEFASCVWRWEDVHVRTGWPKEKCEAWLRRNERLLQETCTAAGNELLDMELGVATKDFDE